MDSPRTRARRPLITEIGSGRARFASKRSGRISNMADPETSEIRLDPIGVRLIGHRILATAAALTAAARPLRLPIEAPATDPISLELSARVDARRRQLALVGESAADELSRMAELIVAGTLHVAALGARTQLAIMGLAAAPISGEIPVSPPATRRASPQRPEPAAGPASADEVLSFAVLLADGRNDIHFEDPADQIAGAEAAAAELVAVATELQAAMSYGERAARTLMSFAAWIRNWASEVDAGRQAEGEWAGVYQGLHGEAATIAGEYVRWLASTMSGAAGPRPATAPATAILAQYRLVTIPAPTLADYPRLAL